jgi:hypothetical protein
MCSLMLMLLLLRRRWGRIERWRIVVVVVGVVDRR